MTAPLSLPFWSRTPPEPQKRPRLYPAPRPLSKTNCGQTEPPEPPRMGSGLWTLSRRKPRGKAGAMNAGRPCTTSNRWAATLNVYQEYGFTSPEQLEAAVDTAYQEMRQTSGELKALETKLQGKKELSATGAGLRQDQTRPRRPESAEIPQSPRSIPAGA